VRGLRLSKPLAVRGSPASLCAGLPTPHTPPTAGLLPPSPAQPAATHNPASGFSHPASCFRPHTVLMYTYHKNDRPDCRRDRDVTPVRPELVEGLKPVFPGAANFRTGEVTQASTAVCACNAPSSLKDDSSARATLRARQTSSQWAHHFFISPAWPTPPQRPD
jgi:hypothetical protein